MGDIVFRFQKLEIYDLAMDIVKDSYSLTKTFPAEERFALVPQMNRAVVSVPSNIAEGISRGTRKRPNPLFEYIVRIINGAGMSIGHLMQAWLYNRYAAQRTFCQNKQPGNQNQQFHIFHP